MKKIITKVLFILMSVCLFSTHSPMAQAKTVWKFFAHYGPTEGACSFIWQDLFD